MTIDIEKKALQLNEELAELEQRHAKYRDCNPANLTVRKLRALIATAREAEALRAENARLKAEMERRSANEIKHCLNWGPCSEMDNRASAQAATALEQGEVNHG